ncbi:MAG: hypothetical protein EOM69_00645 [Clostridia bacterium]|nr:hypothetical protein [Clostridia bacterium]
MKRLLDFCAEHPRAVKGAAFGLVFFTGLVFLLCGFAWNLGPYESTNLAGVMLCLLGGVGLLFAAYQKA